VPAGTKLASSLADKLKGMHYTSKYGMVGANVLHMHVVVDGVNEKGLYVGGFYLPGYASYSDPDPKNAFRSLIKVNFDNVVLVPNPIKEINGESFPGHFIVHDSTGASVVIEPVDKTLKIYENPLGVLTNSPTWDWHMTNIRNYINLTVNNVPPVEVDGITLAQLGQGSGLRGLPGDFSPVTRFLRAVVFSQSAKLLQTEEETVLQVFHIMNAFDIPLGAVRDTHENKVYYDYTVWTSVSDLKNIRWFFKTYNDQSIRSVDVHKALRGAKGKIRIIEMDSEQPIEDVSTRFK